jgi:hypothetical protein
VSVLLTVLLICVRFTNAPRVLNHAAIHRQIIAAQDRALNLYFVRCREPIPVRCLLPTLCAISALPPRPHC